MTTLADFTTEQIRDGLLSALKEQNMRAAASLLTALATRDPELARVLAFTIDMATRDEVSL